MPNTPLGVQVNNNWHNSFDSKAFSSIKFCREINIPMMSIMCKFTDDVRYDNNA